MLLAASSESVSTEDDIGSLFSEGSTTTTGPSGRPPIASSEPSRGEAHAVTLGRLPSRGGSHGWRGALTGRREVERPQACTEPSGQSGSASRAHVVAHRQSSDLRRKHRRATRAR